MIETATSTQWLQFPADLLERLPGALAEGRSSVDAAMQLRRIGFELGDSFADAFVGQIGQPDAGQLTTDEFWEALSAFFADRGWGSLEFRQLHPGVASLSARGWADAEGHLSTGILTSLLSRAAGADVAVMETPGGDDEYTCRFVFGSPAALQALYERLRDGASLDEAVARQG